MCNNELTFINLTKKEEITLAELETIYLQATKQNHSNFAEYLNACMFVNGGNLVEEDRLFYIVKDSTGMILYIGDKDAIECDVLEGIELLHKYSIAEIEYGLALQLVKVDDAEYMSIYYEFLDKYLDKFLDNPKNKSFKEEWL